MPLRASPPVSKAAEKDVLVFEAAPQAFDEDVVHPAAAPVHGDLDVPPPIRTVFGWDFPFMILDREMENPMKASKFSEAQIAFVLKQAEGGTAIGEVCRKAGISEATFYNWRKRYAGLMPSEVKRLRQLEEENAKLKRLVADLSLDKAMLQDVLQKKL